MSSELDEQFDVIMSSPDPSNAGSEHSDTDMRSDGQADTESEHSDVVMSSDDQPGSGIEGSDGYALSPFIIVISHLASLATSGGEVPSDNTRVYSSTISPGDAPRSWIVHISESDMHAPPEAVRVAPRSWIVHISESDMHAPPEAVRDTPQAGLGHLVHIESDVLQWNFRPN